MDTSTKCEAIVRKLVSLANEQGDVVLQEDMGGNSLTIYVGESHTHIGYSSAPFDLLVDNLYNTLHGGPGLSWFTPKGVDDVAKESSS